MQIDAWGCVVGFFVLAYFLIAALAGAVLFLPAFRARTFASIKTMAIGLARGLARVRAGAGAACGEASTLGAGGWNALLAGLAHHRIAVLVALVILVAPFFVAWLFRNEARLVAYDEEISEPNAQIIALLAGEQLVPPAPLPPDVFITPEVQSVRPLLAEASRNWELLTPEFRQRLLIVYRIMREEHGYEMALLEGYRSPERQNALAAMGTGITNAKAFQSYHQFGLAADSAFYRDGKLVISEKDPWAMRGYALYGQMAEKLGLTWGGRWTLLDFGHVELRGDRAPANRR